MYKPSLFFLLLDYVFISKISIHIKSVFLVNTYTKNPIPNILFIIFLFNVFENISNEFDKDTEINTANSLLNSIMILQMKLIN